MLIGPRAGQRRIAVIEAPSALGLTPTGVDGLARTLMADGIADRTHARYVGRIEPPPYHSQRDAETGILNAQAIAQWSPQLADAVGSVLDRGEFPLILGGDCSILLGSLLALKRRGRFGLLFIDGHADFYQPEADPNGEVASMELALATGYGPSLLSNIEGRGPLAQSNDVVAFGFRDVDDQRQHGSQPLPETLLALDLETIRKMGMTAASRAALQRIAHSALDGFFIHLDADCLNDAIMPAVDYRLRDGFSWNELVSALTSALDSGRAVGMEVTIYNPSLDPDGSVGRQLTDMLVDVLNHAPFRSVDV
jgi:arginase